MQPITTTLKAIRQHKPCGLERGSTTGYQKLVKFLGKDYGDETPIRFSQIVESNGVDDAYWCLRALPKEYDNEVRLLLADVAERVLPIYEAKYPDCKKPRQAIEAARAYARGEISKEELAAARAAAWDAARAAAGAARAAAWAAWDAARAAAWATAVRAAAMEAAGNAAWDAERKAQAELLIKRFG
jgi:hypothetical protein